MNKKNTDSNTREYENFDISVWKTDDKTWMKERRNNWPKIKETLDHIKLAYIHAFKDKKSYKYIKEFYLTGYIDFPDEINGIMYIGDLDNITSPLNMREVGGSIGAFLECWLTPEPSEEKWNQIFERYESIWIKRNEPENKGRYFERSKVCFRESILHWYTEDDQLHLFGDLENELTAFFKPFPDSNNYDFYSELMEGFLLTCGWAGSENKYNPNHPIYKYSQQIVASIIPMYFHKLELIIKQQQNSKRKLKYYSEKNLVNYSNKFALFIYINGNSNNSKQVTFAKEILEGIEKLDLPENLIDCLETARENSENEELMKKIINKGSYTLCC